MKISAATDLPTNFSAKSLNPTPDSDLPPKRYTRKPTRREPRNASSSDAGTRLRRDGASAGKKTGPATPLLKWKVDDRDKALDLSAKAERSPQQVRKVRKGGEAVISARKLAAGIWRLRLPEVPSAGNEKCSLRQEEDQPSSFQPNVGHAESTFLCHHDGRAYVSEGKDLQQIPDSVSGTKNGSLWKFDPAFQLSNSAMEGATKWDPICLEQSDKVNQYHSQPKLPNQQESVMLVSALEAELEQAKSRINELETERRSSKKKLEHFLRKLSEERTTWRSKEHEKIRAIIDDIKADLSRERKNRQRLEIVNSKLVNELTDAKLSIKRYIQEYENERKAREVIEEVCDELAKEVGQDKAEVEALKRESMKFREELEEERRMLQMAEVWREERVQMKLVDAKVTLEEKYSQMKNLVVDLENFLRSRSSTQDVKEMREVELLHQAANAVNIQDIKEFTYEPANPDDIFSVFEDINFHEKNEREIGPVLPYSPPSHASKIHTVSPENNVYNKNSIGKNSNAYVDDIEEDGSGWETVSHLEEQGSSYSPEGSDPSVNKIHRDSNVSESETEWEENTETPITEISEVCSVPHQVKKVSSISKLWRSCPNKGANYRIVTLEGMNGRISNGAIISPDRGSGKDGLSPPELVGQWSSPESGNPHIARGMKGCIEWPRGMQRNSLKAKLMEARMESQKIQLRQVLKQKM